MGNDKIIQIMPAPEDLYAVYDMKNDEEYDGDKYYSKIISLALLDNGDVIMLDIDDSGYIDEPNTSSNFIGIEWIHDDNA